MTAPDDITAVMRQVRDGGDQARDIYDSRGAGEVARAAFVPGGPTVEQLTAMAEKLFGSAQDGRIPAA